MFYQIFYIDPPDDLNKVKKVLSEAKRKKIILVFPEENKILKNIESLTLVKDFAQKLGKEISIFTSDKTYRKLAEEAGIPIETALIEESFLTDKEVSFRPKIRDISPKGGKKTLFQKEEIKKEKLPKKIKKSPSKISKGKIFWKVVFFLVGSAGLLYLIFFYLPKAEIEIVPYKEKVEFGGEVFLKPNKNFSEKLNIIPSILVKKERKVKKSFLATGEKNVVQKAQGEIKIINKGPRIGLIKNTRFISENGKVFRTMEYVLVPAGKESSPSVVKVKVQAENAGEEYNIPPQKFSVPGLKGTVWENKLYGESEKKFEGGFIGKASVVSSEDLKKAQKEMERLKEKTKEDLKEEIKKEIPKEFPFLLEKISFDEGEIKFSKKEGERAKIFEGELKISVSTLSFRKEFFDKIIKNLVSLKLKEGFEFEEVKNSRKINFEIKEWNISKKRAIIYFEGEEMITPKIDEKEIKKFFKGKTKEEIQEIFQKKMKNKIIEMKISLWPFFVKKVPQDEKRIFIKIIY